MSELLKEKAKFANWIKLGPEETAEGSGSGGKSGEAANTLFSKSIATMLDVISEGEIQGLVNGGHSIYLNNVPVLNNSGDANFNFKGVSYAVLYGLPDQPSLPGLTSQTEPLSGFTATQIENEAGPVTYAIDDTTVDAAIVTIAVPTLSSTSSDGSSTTGTSVSLTIAVQPNALSDGAWVNAINVNINGKCTSQYEEDFRLNLSQFGPGPWNIKVTRNTYDATTERLQNQTWLQALQISYDHKFSYPYTAAVGLQFDSQYFGSSLPTRSYDVYGIIVQVPTNYDPTTRNYTGLWDGTFKWAWTNNPAWVFYDLLTNDRYGLGLSPAFIDKWGLYTIAQYCDAVDDTGTYVGVNDGFGGLEPRFTFNAVINQQADAYTVLQNLASTFRGMVYWSSIGVSATQDAPTNPLKVFNQANVINGDFEYTGASVLARHTVYVVQWVNPLLNYQADYEVVEDPVAIQKYGLKPQDFQAFGCTSRGQARRAGRWALAAEALNLDTVKFKTGFDGADVVPGMIINIADASYAGIRMGGRVLAVAGDGSTVTIDNPFNFQEGETYQLVIMAQNGEMLTADVANAPGLTTTVQLVADLDTSNLPEVGAIFTLSEVGNVVPRTFRVISCSEDDTGTQFEIVALQHDPSIYAMADDGASFDTTPANIAQLLPNPSYTIPPGAITATQNSKPSAFGTQVYISASCLPSTDPILAGYIWSYRAGEGNWVTLPLQGTTSIEIDNPDVTQVYAIRVYAVNQAGTSSNVVTDSLDLTQNVATGQELVANLATPNADGVFYGQDCPLTWAAAPVSNPTQTATATGATDAYLAGFQVQIKTSGGTVLRTELTQTTSYTYTFEKNQADGAGRSFTVAVAIVDVQGNVSTPTTLACSNPAPTAPSVTFVPSTSGIALSFVPPTDPDYVGLDVYAAATTGFTPGAGNKVWSGPGTPTIPAPANTEVFIRYAFTDVFGEGTMSVEGNATTLAVSLAQLDADLTTAINDATSLVATYGSTASAAASATAAATSATNAAASAGTATTQATLASTAAGNAAVEATNAATSATNAGNSQTAAAGSATTATNEASAASGSATAAAGSATAAASSASNAASSATAASTSASGASTSATNAGNSATAASTSATNAASSYGATVQVGAALLPSDFTLGSTYWTDASAGSPSTVGNLTAGTFQAETGVGQTWKVTGWTTGYSVAVLRTKGVTAAVPGRTYQITMVHRMVSDPSSGADALISMNFQGLDTSYNTLGPLAVTPISGGAPSGTASATVTASQGWLTWVSQWTCPSSSPPPYIRANSGSDNGATAKNGVWEVVTFKVEDVTSQVAAASSAAAANTSASSAATSATNANTSATAASSSATTASTQAGNANTSASAAATSASNANTYSSNAASSASSASGSATAASTSAGNANTYAGQASTSAGNAAASATTAGTQAGNAAGSATSAASSATAASNSATAASNSATLSATFGNNAITPNPMFTAWSGTNPDSWQLWTGSQTYIAKVSGPMPNSNAVQISAPASTDAGLQTTAQFPLSPGYFVIEADVKLVSGSLASAGAYLNQYSGTTYLSGLGINFYTDPDATGVAVGAGAAGQTYYFRKLIQVPATTNLGILYMMGHWSGFGVSEAAANVVQFNRLDLRPASQAEIQGNQALTASTTNAANITSNASAQATINAAQATTNTTLNAVARSSNNLLPFGNFEAGTAHWGGFGAGAVVYNDPSWGQLCYTGTGTGPFYINNGYQIPLAASQTYTISGNIECAGASTGVLIVMNCCNSSGTYLGNIASAVVAPSLSASPPNVQMTGVTPAGTSYGVFYVGVYGPAGSAGYCQRLKVELGSYATAYDTTTTNVINTAAITTNATAVATLGQVYGTYGISVNANGALASMTLFAASGAVTTSGIIFDAASVEIKNGTNTPAALFASGQAYFNAVFVQKLNSNALMTVGTVQWPVALQQQQFSVTDGTTISFGVDLGQAPQVVFSEYGLAALSSGQTYQLSATSLTSTGFTASLKKLTPGTITGASVSTGQTANGLDGAGFQMQKVTAGDSYNGQYSFSVTATVYTAYFGPGDYDGGDTLDMFTYDSVNNWVLRSSAPFQPYTTGVSSSGSHSVTRSFTMTYSGALGSSGYFGVGFSNKYSSGDAITALNSVSWSVQSGATTVTASPNGESCIATVIPV